MVNYSIALMRTKVRQFLVSQNVLSEKFVKFLQDFKIQDCKSQDLFN